MGSGSSSGSVPFRMLKHEAGARASLGRWRRLPRASCPDESEGFASILSAWPSPRGSSRGPPARRWAPSVRQAEAVGAVDPAAPHLLFDWLPTERGRAGSALTLVASGSLSGAVCPRAGPPAPVPVSPTRASSCAPGALGDGSRRNVLRRSTPGDPLVPASSQKGRRCERPHAAAKVSLLFLVQALRNPVGGSIEVKALASRRALGARSRPRQRRGLPLHLTTDTHEAICAFLEGTSSGLEGDDVRHLARAESFRPQGRAPRENRGDTPAGPSLSPPPSGRSSSSAVRRDDTWVRRRNVRELAPRGTRVLGPPCHPIYRRALARLGMRQKRASRRRAPPPCMGWCLTDLPWRCSGPESRAARRGSRNGNRLSRRTGHSSFFLFCWLGIGLSQPPRSTRLRSRRTYCAHASAPVTPRRAISIAALVVVGSLMAAWFLLRDDDASRTAALAARLLDVVGKPPLAWPRRVRCRVEETAVCAPGNRRRGGALSLRDDQPRPGVARVDRVLGLFLEDGFEAVILVRRRFPKERPGAPLTSRAGHHGRASRSCRLRQIGTNDGEWRRTGRRWKRTPGLEPGTPS